MLALIPLDLDGYLFSGWESGKCQQVRSRLAADFSRWQDSTEVFDQQVERVVKALRADGSERERPPVGLL